MISCAMDAATPRPVKGSAIRQRLPPLVPKELICKDNISHKVKEQ